MVGPHSRRNSGYQAFQLQQQQQQSQQYMQYNGQRQRKPSYGPLGPGTNSMLFYQGEQARSQYFPTQQPYYQTSPLPNVPPTPFDTAYGATLLPSHLLMGSPFVATPTTGHSQSAIFQQPYMMTPNRASFSQIPSMLNVGNPPSARRQGNQNDPNRRRSSYRSKVPETDPKTLFLQPFRMSYKILPSGDDAYRTRSLLFENVVNSIELHTFMTEFVRFSPIESVYLINHHDSDKPDDDTECRSILLSFLTREVCLTFYNNVLQRLKEFKAKLKSENLRLSFVSIKYQDENEEEETNIVDEPSFYTKESVYFELSNPQATRSILIQFKNPCSEQELFDKKLKFLNQENNSRYILESIDLVNVTQTENEFPKHYAILTFINILMAMEICDYLKIHGPRYGIQDCMFVQVIPKAVSCVSSKRASIISKDNDNNDETLSSQQKKNDILKNSSIISLPSAENDQVSDEEKLDKLSEKLKSTNIEELILIVDTATYPRPSFLSHDEHLPNATLSLSSSSNPFEQQLPYSYEEDDDQRTNVRSGSLPANPQFPNMPNLPKGYISPNPNMNYNTPLMYPNGYFVNDPAFSMNNNYNNNTNYRNPISKTLEQHATTTSQVVNSLGADAGNRTIYIGNINSRSKVEDICNVVRGGILQNVKYIEHKHICFITFIEASAAIHFYANSFIDPIVLHNHTLKIGWGNYVEPLPKAVALAVTVGASRNVYVSLPEFAFKDKFINDPEYQEYHQKYKLPQADQLRIDFSKYGGIEQINYLKDSHCCWVNFLNISAAIRLVEDAHNPVESKFSEKFNNRYDGLIINYGKDRCGNVNKS